MTKRRRSIIGPVMALAVSGILLGAQPVPEARKGPIYLLIEGGALEAPIVLSGEALLELHSAMIGSEVVEGVGIDSGRVYQVGEFYPSMERTPLPREDGSPSEPLTMEAATAISTIHADAEGGPVWNPYGFGPQLLRSGGRDGMDVFTRIRAGIPPPARRFRYPEDPMPSRAEPRRMPAEVIAAFEEAGLRLGG